MIKKIALLFVIIMLLSFSSFNNFRKLLIEKLEDYTNYYPEKIYVQTDKPYYATGEDIWYTAYLVNGIDHKRSDKSRVIYVELINENDSIVSKKQLYTNDISVPGDFKIRKEWTPGNYMLRAYTNYMRNKDTDYFFQKQIPILNLVVNDSLNDIVVSLDKNKKPLLEKELIEKPEINFYPESGYLINGLISKVALKVKDKQNRHIIVKGTIKDSDGTTICPFETFEFGLGYVTMIPEANKSYYASVIINNQEIKYPLPKALPQGYHLSIVNNGHQIILKATANVDLGLKNSFLVAHQRGKLFFEKLETENKNTYSIKLNTNNLQNGVVNFTLFDNNGKPVCERLVYINNPANNININVSKNKTVYKTRDKVSIQIDLVDKNGNQALGNLSMSVSDLDAVGQNSKSENIKTYLLLNSDLRGNIENPGYFFEKENDIKRHYLLDLVMLTHGWRRFTWNTILYNTAAEKAHFKPETGIYISGRTIALKGTKQSFSAATRLTFMGSDLYQDKKQSNANGAFKYGPFVFNDSIPILIEARVKDFKSDDNKKNRFVNILLDDDFNNSPKVSRNTLLRPNVNDKQKIINFIKQSQSITKIESEFEESARVLDEVIITAQRKSEREKRNTLLNERTSYGFPSNRIDLNDYPNSESLTIFDLLAMIPGVLAYNGSISIRNGGTPRIFLDGIPVEIGDISYMNSGQIEFIDVLKGADAFFFSNSGNGVIAIYSRTGAGIRNINVKRKPGIIDFKALGFYTAREFYAPDHLNGFDEAIKQDIRTTLHWEPKIKLTRDTSKSEVSFFTSDTRSNYAIKIEGITDTGIPVYHLTTLEVD
ncbi:Plug domain-containing protein [Flavivirga amylovorans]|uniref:Plug domain-containing protein n=1 Tax=Flavivirga amylovorans TaxID=870486 RepID=A0ABT8X7P6_9FLAO|nr:Plug domain-containing protein [Flavivirga amylovorans]MDO5989590.1 Plug domain-containing protein [Flavivirga amylovorans]